MKSRDRSAIQRGATQVLRRSISSVLLPSLLLGLGSSLPANGGLFPQPPHSHSFGQSLAEWQATWLEWAFGNLTPPTDAHGNALVNGVVLMAVPNASGDGVPASIDLTLDAGEPFVVPLFLVGGSSLGAMLPESDFANMTLTLTLDDTVILDSSDASDFYTQTVFNPPLPGNGLVFVQGLSIVHAPLPPGPHILKLDEKFTAAGGGFTREFHNTLNLTVLKVDEPDSEEGAASAPVLSAPQ